MTVRRHYLRLQRRFAETPFEVPIGLYFAAIGIVGIASGNGVTPSSLDAALPLWLVQAWTIGLAVGGILTVASRLGRHENPRLESAGLIFLGYGSSLYAAVLLVAADFPSSLFAAMAMIAIATGCIIRIRVLRASARARTLAAEINDDRTCG